tara:strand:- start:2136 stop:2882 length:747 start_codon:yes stop_codon:yes gene_type:complete
MDIQVKRKELTALVDNIKENSDRLTVSHTLPALELSVLISKISKLYEEAIILKHEISKVEFSAVEELLQKPDLSVIKEEKTVLQPIKETDSEIIPEKPAVDIPMEEEPVVSIDTSEKEPELTKKQESVAEEEQEGLEVASVTPYDIDFQDLNTKLSGKEDGSVADQLQKQPIADLTTAVGLNERYLYSNELFGGNMELFREALKELNNKSNLQDANSYLENDLAKKHQWDLNHELVHSLALLVERRFR